jgi:hypothetical protein
MSYFQTLTLSDLWDNQTQSWNEQRLRSVFNEHEVQIIKQLARAPKSNSNMPNRLIWTATKDDRYGVKSRYRSLLNLTQLNQAVPAALVAPF